MSDLLGRKIKEENFDDVLIIVKFIKNNEISLDIKNLENNASIPKEIKDLLFDFSKDLTVDELIAQFLSDESPEQNEELIEALFNKIIEDNEICCSYCCCLIYKFGYLYFFIDD